MAASVPKSARGAALAAGLLILAGCGSGAAEVADEPPIVRVAIVEPAGGGLDRYTGVVAPRIESALGFVWPAR
jgi:hypothetical protein